MKPLDQKTPVALGLVIVLAGGIFWLSSLHALANSTSQRVDKTSQRLDKYADDVSKIREDVAYIRAKIERN